MSKKKWIIIVLIMLAVLLSGSLVFLGLKNRDTEYGKLGKINKIEFSIGKEEYKLVKEDNRWYWEDQEGLLLEDSYIEEQARVAKKELDITKTEDKGSLKKYGLDNPEYSLTLKDTRGRKLTIYVGDSLSAGLYFARVGSEKDIYTASWKIMEVIDSLSAMREKSENMEFVGE